MKLGIVHKNDGELERVSSGDLLDKGHRHHAGQRTPDHQKRLGVAMRQHGWTGPDLTGRRRRVRGYERTPVEDWER